jgi:membrane protein implicated in regulation of membrane protease activity
MLYGVERQAVSPLVLSPEQIGSAPTFSPPRVRYWFPLTAAFLVGFGVAGYVVFRRSSATGMSVVAGLLTGVILAALASRLVSRAAAFVPEHDPDDPRYVLQGHVARVTAPIAGSAEGEIAYAVHGANHVARARTLDGAAVDAGTEVVIERIEDGIAYVEPWSEVEQRL